MSEEAAPKEAFVKLSRDLKKAARHLSRANARWMIDQYYTIQDERIRSASQGRANASAEEPKELIDWIFDTMRRFEAAIQGALGEYAKQYKVGQWMMAQYGIGPVLAAACLAHLEIEGRPTVGAFWRFSGLDPTSVWEKKTKRPWNAQLKSILVFKMGESFVKFHGRDKCFYGKLWKQQKDKLWLQNLAGKFSGQATADMEASKYKMTTQAYRWVRGEYSLTATEAWLKTDNREKPPEAVRDTHVGTGIPMLPPAQIHARARRWTVKLFLSHLHEVMHHDWYDKAPPAPYIFEHPGGDAHVHLLKPQLWPGEYDGASLKSMR